MTIELLNGLAQAALGGMSQRDAMARQQDLVQRHFGALQAAGLTQSLADVQLLSKAAPLVTSTVYNSHTDEFVAALNAVPDMLPADQAFAARQLVMQAQADYKRALERGNKHEADLAKAEAMRRAAELERDAARQRAEHVEQQLRGLQPLIRKRVVPQDSVQRSSHELRAPWFWCSWALIAAGLVVCAL